MLSTLMKYYKLNKEPQKCNKINFYFNFYMLILLQFTYNEERKKNKQLHDILGKIKENTKLKFIENLWLLLTTKEPTNDYNQLHGISQKLYVGYNVLK